MENVLFQVANAANVNGGYILELTQKIASEKLAREWDGIRQQLQRENFQLMGEIGNLRNSVTPVPMVTIALINCLPGPYVMKSPIVGKDYGLFADKNYSLNDNPLSLWYGGVEVDEDTQGDYIMYNEQTGKTYDASRYFFLKEKGRWVNDGIERDGVHQYRNESNMRFQRNTLVQKLTRKGMIKRLAEILIDYGPYYSRPWLYASALDTLFERYTYSSTVYTYDYIDYVDDQQEVIIDENGAISLSPYIIPARNKIEILRQRGSVATLRSFLVFAWVFYGNLYMKTPSLLRDIPANVEDIDLSLTKRYNMLLRGIMNREPDLSLVFTREQTPNRLFLVHLLEYIDRYTIVEIPLVTSMEHNYLISLVNIASNTVSARVELKQSGIPGAGMGLFAKTRFTIGETIAVYGGGWLSPNIESEADYTYKLGPAQVQYHAGWQLRGDIDFALGDKARWCNTSLDDSELNADFQVFLLDEESENSLEVPNVRVFLICTAEYIEPGQEIFLDYGDEYRDSLKNMAVVPPSEKKQRIKFCIKCNVNNARLKEENNPAKVYCSEECFTKK